jgi:hypothetical protein
MPQFIEEILKQMNTQLSRIDICVSKLSQEDIWKRLNNSIWLVVLVGVHLLEKDRKNSMFPIR